MFDFKNYQWRKMAKNGEKWRWRICLFHLSNSPFRHWPPPPPPPRSSRNGLDKYLSYCLKGLTIYRNITTDLRCITHHSFIFPNHRFFGVENKTAVTLPATPQNCDHMFGEMYVYTSCTNKCIKSSCPLKTIPKYEMCPVQYPNGQQDRNYRQR